jgi:MFS family permease
MEIPANSAADPAGKLALTDVRASRYSWYALGVLTGLNFLNYIDRQILPAVGPLMQRELNLTDTEIGAFEAALLLSFTILAPLFGRLGDRYSRTKLMAGAAVLWSLATGLTAVADRWPVPAPLNVFTGPVYKLSGIALTICLVRAMVGVGESSYSTITPTLVADYMPLQRRATALGVFQAAIPMGFALGFVLGGLLGAYFGWRVAFMVVGLPGLITSVFVWRLREPERGKQDLPLSNAEPVLLKTGVAVSAARQSSWRTFWRIIRTRDWFLSTAGYTALTFVLGAFSTWASFLLANDKHMTPEHAAYVLGITIFLAGAAGTFGGGWVADRVAAKLRNGYFLVCAASSLLGIVPCVIALTTHEPLFYIPAIFVTVVFLFSNNAPFHAILVNSVPPTVRASAMALNILAIHTFGDLISRQGVGLLSDSVAAGHLAALGAFARLLGIDPLREHLTAALLVVPAALLVSALFFFWGGWKQKQDAHAAGFRG